MDHWHAESLLIRIISIFQQGLCFFFRSYVERRRLSGPASCQSSRRLRPPCSLLLTSSPPFAFTSVRGPASTPPPSPPPLLYNRKLKRGGRGTSQHALHPHLVTSRSVMYACFHLRGVFSTSVRPSFVHPSFLPSSLRFALRGFSSNQLCGEGAWRLTRSRAVQPSLTDLLHRVLGHRGELLRCEVAGGEFRGAEVESDGCHPTSSDYSRVIDFI